MLYWYSYFVVRYGSQISIRPQFVERLHDSSKGPGDSETHKVNCHQQVRDRRFFDLTVFPLSQGLR